MASGTSDSDDEGRADTRLLGANDPHPVEALNPQGGASFLLVADHAGRLVPERLGTLGLNEADARRHIAWDIGVAALGEALAMRLDAMLIRQRYSRLVIDCNRDPARADAIPEVSDGTAVPANAALSDGDRAARVADIHAPYQAAIAAELVRRDAAGLNTVLVALHSFTPKLDGVMDGFARPWHAGVLYGGGDETFARAALAHLTAALDAPVGDNQPYAMDGIDHTVPHHCFAAGRAYVEFEIRQDLLGDMTAIDRWSDILAGVLRATRP